MTEKQVQGQLTFMKYFNSGALTLILALVTMLNFTMQDIRKTQVDMGNELIRIKTVQDNNTNNISSLTDKIYNIETNDFAETKFWVEMNFQRKP